MTVRHPAVLVLLWLGVGCLLLSALELVRLRGTPMRLHALAPASVVGLSLIAAAVARPEIRTPQRTLPPAMTAVPAVLLVLAAVLGCVPAVAEALARGAALFTGPARYTAAVTAVPAAEWTTAGVLLGLLSAGLAAAPAFAAVHHRTPELPGAGIRRPAPYARCAACTPGAWATTWPGSPSASRSRPRRSPPRPEPRPRPAGRSTMKGKVFSLPAPAQGQTVGRPAWNSGTDPGARTARATCRSPSTA
ncbi:monovalent cation/H(+) antiporter subunit G [Streptomyces sp. NPDC085524]|uniref:monovalent cation/H(+) antiporter subunit G n=1 Tax=Streptomyces sp. NPDC085524 TaxID=3365728 RepID=UPI0037D267C1